MHFRAKQLHKITLLFLMIHSSALFYACRTTKSTQPQKEETLKQERSQKTALLLKTARSYNGTKYKIGGTDSKGMDCSGLVFASFNALSIPIPRTSKAQSEIGKEIKEEEIAKGDLIFFATGGKAQGINHVGIVISHSKGEAPIFIHSTLKSGVIENNLSEPYYRNCFVKAMRVY